MSTRARWRALAGLSVAGAAALGACGDVLDNGPESATLDGGARPLEDGAPLEAEGPVDAGAADTKVAPSLMVAIPAAGALPAFEIDVTEVTQGQYADFVARGTASVVQGPECAFNTGFSPSKPNYTPAATPHLPVIGIDWCDAAAYCRWVGKRLCGGGDGAPGRYADNQDPTKSEWLRACTKNGTQSYPYGAVEQATACNVTSAGATGLADAGSRATCEGGFAGIRDMVGNATEWVDLCDDAGCAIMGGSWRFGSGAVECRALTASTRNAAFDDLGFRCCR